MLVPVGDGTDRCWWPGDDTLYQAYHDNEWGRAVTSDAAIFEKISLEGFQSGLSWITILRKRENFRKAFAHFDHHKIASFTAVDIDNLMADSGIVRHRGKIEAVVNNAQRFCELEADGISLAHHVWSFVPHKNDNTGEQVDDEAPIRSTSPESLALSKDLKKRGWKFVGPTTVYSMMQAIGMVNDHIDGCFVRSDCEQLRSSAIQQFSREAR